VSKKSRRVTMFAVVRTGGKQYKVSVGDVIKVEKLDGISGSTIKLTDVICICDNSEMKHANLQNVYINCNVLEQKRNKKVVIFKKKRRHNYRRKKGHRQFVTILKVESIVA
jgi:large subunit ribosomal protein L21